MVESRTDPAFDESQSKVILLFGLKSLKSCLLTMTMTMEKAFKKMCEGKDSSLGKLVASLR